MTPILDVENGGRKKADVFKDENQGNVKLKVQEVKKWFDTKAEKR